VPGDELPGAAAGFRGRAADAGVDVPAQLTWGSLQVDVDRYAVRVDGAPVDLTPLQIELLALFLASPGQVWTRGQLHAVCWGQGTASRAVDVQLSRIRARIGIDVFRNLRARGWALRPV
jgi:two-component system, OmpR family, response regulator MtrA